MPDPGRPDIPASRERLTVIVVSYNTRDMTLECLRSLEANIDRATTQVIVVDNTSSDGSAEAIADAFPWIELVALRENIGFARANNLAAESARGEFVLLLNPDTVVLDGAIEKLTEFAARTPKARIWGGRTLFADGSLNIFSCQARLTPWNLFCLTFGLNILFRGSRVFDRQRYGWWLRDTERAVDIVSGCFLLITREEWDALGGFDEAFFLYGEESDLCLRARARDARPRVTPDATIIHHGGASQRVRADRSVRLFTAFRLLIERHWSPPAAAYGRAMLTLWPITRSLGHAARSRFGHADSSETASHWREVFRRRHEWLGLSEKISSVRSTQS